MEQSFWGFNITPLACNPSISTITTASQQCPWGFTWVVGAWWACDCQRVTWGMFVFQSCEIWIEPWNKAFEASLACNPSISTITTTSQQCPWGFTWGVGALLMCSYHQMTWLQFLYKVIKWRWKNGTKTFQDFNYFAIDQCNLIGVLCKGSQEMCASGWGRITSKGEYVKSWCPKIEERGGTSLNP